jgi:hypothetical protein
MPQAIRFGAIPASYGAQKDIKLKIKLSHSSINFIQSINLPSTILPQLRF